jgi:hypothetical protein
MRVYAPDMRMGFAGTALPHPPRLYPAGGCPTRIGCGRSKEYVAGDGGFLSRSHILLACIRLVGSAALLIAGCHVQLVSDYDEDFVKAAVSTEKEIDGFLQDQRNPPLGTDPSYDGNKTTYNKIEVDLDSLLVLARSHLNNDPSINQVTTAIDTFHGLENIHRRRGRLSIDFIDAKEQTFITEFSSMIRTENAKKAGR